MSTSTHKRVSLDARCVSHATVQDDFENVFMKRKSELPSVLGSDSFWLSFHKVRSAPVDDATLDTIDAEVKVIRSDRSSKAGMSALASLLFEDAPKELVIEESKSTSRFGLTAAKRSTDDGGEDVEMKSATSAAMADATMDESPAEVKHLFATVACGVDFVSPYQLKVRCTDKKEDASDITTDYAKPHFEERRFEISGCNLVAPMKKIHEFHPAVGGSGSVRLPIVTQSLAVGLSEHLQVPIAVSGSYKGELSVVNLKSNRLLWRVPMRDSERMQRATADFSTVSLFPHGDLIAAGDSTGALHIFTVSQTDTANVKPSVSIGMHTAIAKKKSGHLGDVTSIDFIDEGASIVSGAADGTVRLWDASTQSQIHCFGSLSLDRVNRVLVTDSITLPPTDACSGGFVGKSLVTCSNAGFVSVFDVRCKKRVADLVVSNSDGVTDISLLQSPSLPLPTLALSCVSGIVSLFDFRKLSAMCELASVRRDSNAIGCILADNSGIIAANGEGHCWKWAPQKSGDLSTIEATHEFSGHSRFGISTVALYGKSVFIADKNGACFQHGIA